MAERTMKMNEFNLVTTNEHGQQIVSARGLYKELGTKQRFSAWFNNNKEMFDEGTDFNRCTSGTPVTGGNGNVQYLEDYTLTIDMAKELAMMSRSSNGKEVRLYFIEVEKQFNSPEMMMARSLQYANQTLLQYDKHIKELNTTIEEQKPKVEMVEKLLEADDANISMADFAKVLANYGIKMGRNTLMKELRNSGWLLKNNTPSAKAMEREIFKVHETVINTGYGTRIQSVTTITPKGQKFLIERVTRNQVA